MRGAIAGGFVAALIGYAVISLVVQPVRETALIPIVESRGKAIPWGGDNQIEGPAWNFVFVSASPTDSKLTLMTRHSSASNFGGALTRHCTEPRCVP